MKTKLLITLGCSYTEGVGCYDPSVLNDEKLPLGVGRGFEVYTKSLDRFHNFGWPSRLQKKLQYDSLWNIGHGGASNSETAKRWMELFGDKNLSEEYDVLVLWMVTYAERIRNIPFEAISINENQLAAIIITGEKIPGLKIMLDHIAQPPLNDINRFQQWQVLMSQAAINPQIFVKLSGLGTITRQAGMLLEEAINDPIKHVLEEFSPKRICCGGDWPISLLGNQYTEIWKSYSQVIHSLTTTDSDLSAIFFNNAVEFYSLSVT